MARTILPLDGDYPSTLLGLKKPPELTVEGPLDAPGPRVAIVGSRAADGAAETFARDLARALARKGVCVVSGGAKGIDGAAHRGALDARGVTWVIAPFGRGAPCFPPEHKALFHDVITGGGAMVYTLGANQRARSFPARNRIMVALVHAVVVVQAEASSGTLNTAKHALEQGRPLWVATPAPWLEGFEGSRTLLHDPNVRALWSVEELFEDLARLDVGVANANAPAGAPAPSEPEPELVGDARVLVDCLTVPRHRDELVLATGWSPSRLASVVFELGLEGTIIEEVDGRLRKTNKTSSVRRNARTGT